MSWVAMESLSEEVEHFYNNFSEAIVVLASYVRGVQQFILDTTQATERIVQKFKKLHEGEEVEPDPEANILIELDEGEVALIFEASKEHLDAMAKYPHMLMDMAFIYLVALFDAYLVDVFTAVLIHRPETLKSKKQLTYEKIIELNVEGNLISYLARREVNQLSYRSIAEQAEYYKSKFNVNLADSGVDIKTLTKIRAIRNLLVHNNGVVNSTFMNAVKHSEYQLRERIVITAEYWEECWQQLRTVATFMLNAILDKFDKN